jgi:hypothetical protein
MRSIGLVKKFSEDPEQNDREFKCAVRWIICGDVEDRTTHVFTEAHPDDWPGMAFHGGKPYEVFEMLLREYAPRRWPEEWPNFSSKLTLKQVFAADCEQNVAPAPVPREWDDEYTDASISRIDERTGFTRSTVFFDAICDILFRDHQEPCLILDAECLRMSRRIQFSLLPFQKLRTNHANCICDVWNGGDCWMIDLKDSNNDEIEGFFPVIPGLLTSDHHERAGPSVVWIQPGHHDIRVFAPQAVSLLTLIFQNQNLKEESSF